MPTQSEICNLNIYESPATCAEFQSNNQALDTLKEYLCQLAGSDQIVGLSDSYSIDFVDEGNGIYHADAIISSHADNILTIRSNDDAEDGLFVDGSNLGGGLIDATSDTNSIDHAVSAGTLTSDVNISADANNAVEIRNDGLFTNLTGNFTDTATVNHTLNNNVLSSDVKISFDAGNDLTAKANGLYISIPDAVQTTTDTATIDHNLTGTDLESHVILSSDSNNILEVLGDGLYADLDGTINSVGDTDTINMSLTGGTISGVVRISGAAGNDLSANSDGLYVDAGGNTSYIDSIADTNSINLGVTNGELSATTFISGDSGNAIEIRGDGLYAPQASSGLAVNDTQTIDLSLNTGTDPDELSANVRLDGAADNIIQSVAGGLYVPDISIASGSQDKLSYNSSTREISITLSDITQLLSGGDGIAYDANTGEIAVDLSADAGNDLSFGTDTGVFLDVSGSDVTDTNNLSGSGAGSVVDLQTLLDAISDNTFTYAVQEDQILFGDTSGNLDSSANLTYDGTTLSVATDLSVAGSLIDSAGNDGTGIGTSALLGINGSGDIVWKDPITNDLVGIDTTDSENAVTVNNVTDVDFGANLELIDNGSGSVTVNVTAGDGINQTFSYSTPVAGTERATLSDSGGQLNFVSGTGVDITRQNTDEFVFTVNESELSDIKVQEEGADIVTELATLNFNSNFNVTDDGSGIATVSVDTADIAQLFSFQNLAGGGQVTLSDGGGNFSIIGGTNVTVDHTSGDFTINASASGSASYPDIDQDASHVLDDAEVFDFSSDFILTVNGQTIDVAIDPNAVGSDLEVQDSGASVDTAVTVLDFGENADVTQNSGGNVTVDVPKAGTIQVEDDNSSLTTDLIDLLNFQDNLSATYDGSGQVTINAVPINDPENVTTYNQVYNGYINPYQLGNGTHTIYVPFSPNRIDFRAGMGGSTANNGTRVVGSMEGMVRYDDPNIVQYVTTNATRDTATGDFASHVPGYSTSSTGACIYIVQLDSNGDIDGTITGQVTGFVGQGFELDITITSGAIDTPVLFTAHRSTEGPEFQVEEDGGVVEAMASILDFQNGIVASSGTDPGEVALNVNLSSQAISPNGNDGAEVSLDNNGGTVEFVGLSGVDINYDGANSRLEFSGAAVLDVDKDDAQIVAGADTLDFHGDLVDVTNPAGNEAQIEILAQLLDVETVTDGGSIILSDGSTNDGAGFASIVGGTGIDVSLNQSSKVFTINGSSTLSLWEDDNTFTAPADVANVESINFGTLLALTDEGSNQATLDVEAQMLTDAAAAGGRKIQLGDGSAADGAGHFSIIGGAGITVNWTTDTFEIVNDGAGIEVFNDAHNTFGTGTVTTDLNFDNTYFTTSSSGDQTSVTMTAIPLTVTQTDISQGLGDQSDTTIDPADTIDFVHDTNLAAGEIDLDAGIGSTAEVRYNFLTVKHAELSEGPVHTIEFCGEKNINISGGVATIDCDRKSTQLQGGSGSRAVSGTTTATGTGIDLTGFVDTTVETDSSILHFEVRGTSVSSAGNLSSYKYSLTAEWTGAAWNTIGSTTHHYSTSSSLTSNSSPDVTAFTGTDGTSLGGGETVTEHITVEWNGYVAP